MDWFLYDNCLRLERVKARNFGGMKILWFYGWDLKSAKLKCHQKYFFSSTAKLKYDKIKFLDQNAKLKCREENL